MNAFRFRPALESLDNRLMPSAAAPVVTIEYLVVAAAPSPSQDDVVVDGRIITGENPTSAADHKGEIELISWSFDAVPAAAALPKPMRLLETRSGLDVHHNEWITGVELLSAAPLAQPVRLLDTSIRLPADSGMTLKGSTIKENSGIDANETITVHGNHTDFPAVQYVRELPPIR